MSKSKVYSVDWANDDKCPEREEKDRKETWFDGKKIRKPKDAKSRPKIGPDDIVVGENLPDGLIKWICDKGATLYYCSTHRCKEWRDKAEELNPTLDWRKTKTNPQDELDAKILWCLYESFPDTFYKEYYDPLFTDLKMLVAARERIQKTRGAFHNQVFATGSEPIAEFEQEFIRLEKEADKEIKKRLKELPIYTEFLKDVDGMAEATAARLIAYTKDIRRFTSFEKLCSYFGLHVVEGKAPRREKGQQANWHQKGRALLLGIVASKFIMQVGKPPIDSKTGKPKLKKDGTVITKKRSKFRDLYEQSKEAETGKIWTGETVKKQNLIQGEPIPPWMVEKRAKRKIVKEFLREFYDKSKELVGE
jgi:hypothetical protein